MPFQDWHQTLTTQEAQGSLLNAFTTAKSVLNPEALITLPSKFFRYAGQQARMIVTGAISNIVTTPGTMVFQLMMGTIVAWTSGNIQLNASAHTTLPFWLDVLLTCQAVGASTSAKLTGQGLLVGLPFTNTAGQTDGANTQTCMTVPTTAPAQGAGFDSTAAQTADFWAGFSINNAGNGIQINQFSFQSLN
jgi:hypothetical protein